MNYQNLKTLAKDKLAKNLTAFVVLTFTISLIFFSKISVPQSLGDCNATAGPLQPGSNCLFYGLPLCQSIPGAGYNIPASSITSQIPNHRVNCADLSDLPLCTQIDGVATPVKNCTKECNDASFDGYAGVRGQDYAVHNRDCIRFCDAPEVGVTADPATNCVPRKCHQLANGVNPNPTIAPTNCEIFNCNLLTPDELNEVKFDDSSKKYCEGTNIKCFDFTAAQLPYVRSRPLNTMCKIHNCRADSEECVPFEFRKFRCDGPTHTTLNTSCDITSTCDASGYCTKREPDDVQKILDKGVAYSDLYKTYINVGYDIESKATCALIVCRPVLYRQYRCSPFEEVSPTTLNVSCDQTVVNVDGDTVAATCSGGYCTKKIDCNLPVNNNEPECTSSNLGTSSGTVDDTGVDSWFYRPQPPGSAVTGAGVLRTMDSSLCYSKGQMLDHGWGDDAEIDMGLFTIPLGYFHWDNRSPEMCGTPHVGHRGNGYIYLCGADGLLYRKANPDTAYHKGYVKTDYVEGDATHKINICVRYNNTMNVRRSCGSRECMIVCAFDICTQQCGSDVCRELTLTDSHPDDCAMENGGSGDCSSTIEDYVRIRAVKYKDYICTFLDMKGALAYDPQYYDGTEKMSDGTCFSGINVDGTCTGAKNTNDDRGSASVWRTLFQIPYVQNNRPAGEPVESRGYLDAAGRLFKEHECIKVPYRIHIPRTYNLANLTNSPNLFTPPLYILNSRLQRGASISVGTEQEPLGTTDFNYPEIEVRFGTTTQKLSLGINYTGYENGGSIDPQGSATISTSINGFNYVAEIFVRKEEFINSNTPIFCLYRKIKDSNGVYLDPLRVKCVKRLFPEIDNSALKIITPSIDLRKVVISPTLGNTFSSSSLSLRYLSSSNISSVDCSSGGASCTSELSLGNLDPAVPTCDLTLERHEICVQREECSKLNVECMQNEVAMYAALNSNQPIDSFLSVRQNCNEILLPLCNSKKGFLTPASSTIIGSNPNRDVTDSRIYGWFNEICITTGFETKLKNIVAYDLSDDLKGKCTINPASPYLTDGNASTNCNSGGKAPNCLCIEALEDVEPGPGYEVRIQTPREAGLCIDIPLPQTCPVIDYNLTANPNSNDPDFVASSLNYSIYGTSTADINSKVHISHKYRTEGKLAPDPILLRGHAEFPASVIGTADVNGECKGFWTYQRSLGGTIARPKLSCLDNSGIAGWEATARNACVRYQCSQVFTAGPDVTGFYQGNYGLLETGEDKGLSHGFAMWPTYTKTNDALESVTATSCITGFKKTGAVATTSTGSVTGANAISASLYKLITGYSGGTSPTRSCNQLGQWLNPTNSCQRISCPAVTPPNPSGSNDNAAWELWRNSGGATFPAVNASRSTSRIQNESISTGTCNNALGYFRSPGGQPPTRECNHLGNWSDVINPCATACTAITEGGAGTANNFNNGFAKWGIIKKEVTLYQHCDYGGWSAVLELGDYPSIGGYSDASSFRLNGSSVKMILYSGPNFTGSSYTLTGDNSCFTNIGFNDTVRSFKIQTASGNSLVGEFQGCVAGYVTNPYSPRFNIDGTPLSAAIANDLTRPAQNPQRLCQITNNAGFTSSVWGGVINGCINQCPGSDEDPRVGVGVTSHQTSSGAISVNWPATPLGQDAYISNHGNEAVLGASFFLQNRTNGFYLLRRHCGNDGKWATPDVMCSANNGQIGNSVYLLPLPTLTGFKNSIVAGNNSTVTGACVSNSYWKYNYDQDPLPKMSCNFDATNKIDKVYLALTGGTRDCEERRCRAFTAYKGLRASIPGIAFDDPRTAINGQIQGTCLNNTTNSAGTTVYTTLENGTGAPHVKCQSNGTWSGVVGEANCKHGCDFGPWGTIRVNHGGCGDGMFYAGLGFNFKHGQQIRYGITDDCDRWCGALTTGYYCNDGNGYLNYSWAWDPAWNVCRFANYNGPTNSFSGTIDTGAFSSYYFPEGNSYTDKYGNAQNFSFSVWD